MKPSSFLRELFLEVLLVPLSLLLASAAFQPAVEAWRAADHAIHSDWMAAAGSAAMDIVRRGCPCAVDVGGGVGQEPRVASREPAD